MARILIIDDDNILRKDLRSLLSSAGHEVFDAPDGHEGLAKLHRHNPDLVLLDFIMPGMNGFQFCAAMRAIKKHQDTPVVLLSARTDKVGDRFIERFGVSDAISKPLEDELLLAVIEKVLTDAVRRPATSRAVPKGFGSISETQAIAAAAGRIVGFISQFEELRKYAELIRESVTHALSEGDPSGAQLLVHDLSNTSASPELTGSLATVPLGDIMQLLAMQQQTGILEVSSSGSSVSIQFRLGQVEIAVATGVRPEFLLGRYLVEENLLSRQDLDLLLRNRKGTKRLGNQLLKLGYINEDQLALVLARQTREIMFEIMRWDKGRFTFYKNREVEGTLKNQVPIEVAHLVMEGLRQIDEWRLFEREITNFDTIIEPAANHDSLFDVSKLTDEETFLLGLIDNPITVRDVIDASNKSSFATCKIIYRLLSVNLLKRVESTDNIDLDEI